MSAPNLRLIGLHFHLGSPIYEIEPYTAAIDVTMSFAAEMQDRHGLELKEFSPGGGFAIQYTADEPPPEVSEYAAAITSAILERTQTPPRLLIEPGRAIAGRAGVALYSVGTTKDVPGNPQVRVRGRRDGRQHTARHLRVSLRGRCRQPGFRAPGRDSDDCRQVLRVWGHLS